MAKRSSASKVDAFPPNTRLGVVCGDEPFLKEQKVLDLKAALQAQHGEVQTFLFDGKTASLADVLDEVRSYSLMQTYKLVIVDDADVFISGRRASDSDDSAADDEDAGSGSKREALMRYAQSPVDHATLIFRSVRWNPGKLDKLIEAHGAVIKCEPVSEATAVGWLQERSLAAHGRKIEPKAAGTLVARLGTDLMQLDTELAKLVTAAGKDQPVTIALIEQMIGRSSEEDAWAIKAAYLRGIINGPGDAIDKLHEVVELSGQPKVLVTFAVIDMVKKLYAGAMMKARGASDRDIATALKLWGEEATLLPAALRKINSQKAAIMFDKAMQADLRSKTGLSESHNEPPRTLECLAVTLHEIAKA